MKEYIVEGLYTDLSTLKQLESGARSSVPVRKDMSMFANPVRCKITAEPEDGEESLTKKILVGALREVFKNSVDAVAIEVAKKALETIGVNPKEG